MFIPQALNNVSNVRNFRQKRFRNWVSVINLGNVARCTASPNQPGDINPVRRSSCRWCQVTEISTEARTRYYASFPLRTNVLSILLHTIQVLSSPITVSSLSCIIFILFLFFKMFSSCCTVTWIIDFFIFSSSFFRYSRYCLCSRAQVYMYVCMYVESV